MHRGTWVRIHFESRGKDRKAKIVGYGLQLREKQKVRRAYGLLESQFRITYEKAAHAKGRGVIGMKLIGNGQFKTAADREKAMRYAMACKEIDAVVIGFTSTKQIDEGVELMNRVLAEG